MITFFFLRSAVNLWPPDTDAGWIFIPRLVKPFLIVWGFFNSKPDHSLITIQGNSDRKLDTRTMSILPLL